MNNETPATIRAWIDETFPNSSQRARVRRSVKEWLELDEALERGASAEVIAEEAADVAICAMAWAGPDDLSPRSYYPVGASLLELIDRRYFVGMIANLAVIVGGEDILFRAINAKMAKNRKRIWAISPDGTGKHVGEHVVPNFKAERDTLVRTVERVRRAASEMTKHAAGSAHLVQGCGREILAILDGKEG